MKEFFGRGINGMHFGKQCFWCNILVMWPRDRTKYYTYLIEIVNITQLTENSMIKIGGEIKDSFLTTNGLYINPKTW